MNDPVEIRRVDARSRIRGDGVFVRRAKRLWARDTHWLELAVAMLLLPRGFSWLFAPTASASPVYDRLTDVLDYPAWGIIFTLTGLGLLVATLINGDRHWTPYARAIGLLCALFINLLLTLAFLAIGTATALQAGMTQAVLAFLCAWGALNVASKAR